MSIFNIGSIIDQVPINTKIVIVIIINSDIFICDAYHR